MAAIIFTFARLPFHMILRENFLHAVVMNLPPGKTSIDQSGDRGTTRFSNAPGTESRTGSSKEPNTIVLEDRVNLGKSGNSIPEAKHHSGENVPVPRHRERHRRDFTTPSPFETSGCSMSSLPKNPRDSCSQPANEGHHRLAVARFAIDWDGRRHALALDRALHPARHGPDLE
ncbi:hypothetical protein [Synechococcus sp. CCY9202]|uniref:hypothetical protein n=1 Tax=Synechococcus sp. CCY9202 TaxID=174698 RepID=UPI002B1F672A|nr:hypothetical protein [Synechococcus sp. CCY9202]MEA5423811.1 hypothetical protein [Synechococcus sp. CCY9202]